MVLRCVNNLISSAVNCDIVTAKRFFFVDFIEGCIVFFLLYGQTVRITNLCTPYRCRKLTVFFTTHALRFLWRSIYGTYERRLVPPVLFIVNLVDDDAADDLHRFALGVVEYVLREFCKVLANFVVVANFAVVLLKKKFTINPRK